MTTHRWGGIIDVLAAADCCDPLVLWRTGRRADRHPAVRDEATRTFVRLSFLDWKSKLVRNRLGLK